MAAVQEVAADFGVPVALGGGSGKISAKNSAGATTTNSTGVTGPQCPPDVKNTVERINKGQSYPHRNDGTTFNNKENLLPAQPTGHYKEYVHPTQGLQGPGAQRVVIGKNGEIYFTPDHYRTFIPYKP